MLKIPEEARPRLKRPLGELFSSTPKAVERVRQLRPAKLIAIGDIVTAELLAAGLKPDIAVVDFKVMRTPAGERVERAIKALKAPIIKVKNPAGTITPELREALEGTKTPLKILVEGEEDLAVLPAVLAAPLGSVVAYGQPGEGMVLVEVTGQKKSEFEALLKFCEPSHPK